MRRLQGWALFEGFAVVQGRVWKDQTPRWQFLCKQHGTKTANTRDLEARKDKDEEGNVVTDRQRDTMIKAKKDCHFEYNLSYKPVSRGSSCWGHFLVISEPLPNLDAKGWGLRGKLVEIATNAESIRS